MSTRGPASTGAERGPLVAPAEVNEALRTSAGGSTMRTDSPPRAVLPPLVPLVQEAALPGRLIRLSAAVVVELVPEALAADGWGTNVREAPPAPSVRSELG
jgi:hypothetical protein